MNEKKRHIALLAGGRSGERAVSLAGAAEVEKALDRKKFTVTRYDAATDIPRLAADAPQIDMVFILLHGPYGEDGTVQGLLELLDLPYQGAGVLGSALAMDKNLAKIMYRQHGLPVPAWEMATSAHIDDPAPLIAALGLPLVVKPLHQGSSLGMSIAATAEELARGLEAAFAHDREVMVEQFIKGREITVGVIGNNEPTPLPVVEIIPGSDYPFFDYQAKYEPGASREICPADLPPDLAHRARDYALTAHRALHLRGYSRTDMLVRGDDIFLLETNTIPGMTPTSLLPQAAAAAGLPFPKLIERLIDLALEER